jgi:diguanylate cyclase (GGDEF)-like protein
VATILVVDDEPAGRELLATIVRFRGHELLEAADGAEALIHVRDQRPDLVISDILMPTMDGYEFVRRLRADPELASTQVVFYTASYHEQEAQRLAESGGVARVLVKPCEPAELLEAIDQVLTGKTPEVRPEIPEAYDGEHLRLVSDKLWQQAEALKTANAQLAALNELNVRLASEQDPGKLLEKVCSGARKLIGSRYAVLAARQKEDDGESYFTFSGIEAADGLPGRPDLGAGALGEVWRKNRPWRKSGGNGAEPDAGLPPGYPPARAFLAVPLASLEHVYGWICLADKLGADAFSEEDERVLAVLGAQVGRIYENGSLYRALQRHTELLRAEMEDKERATEELRRSAARIEQLNRTYAFLSGINSLIVRAASREELFAEACRLAVDVGRFTIAWIGWLDRNTGLVEPAARMQRDPASSGPPGPSKGLRLDSETMAARAMRSQAPQICNDLRIEQQAIPFREELMERGCRALVAIPLVMNGESVGCLELASGEADFFSEEEMRLLTELAGDISFALDHIAKSEQLSYVALYDTPTGLANRTLFLDRLAQSLQVAGKSGRRIALVVMAPERLGNINDTFGRPAGDTVLAQFAERCSAAVGPTAEVARTAGDVLAAMIDYDRDPNEALEILRRWKEECFSTPFEFSGTSLRLSGIAGIALFPEDGEDAETLLKNAESALERAKSSGEAHLFYTRQMSSVASRRLLLEHELRGAIENREFLLYYQPKVELETRRMTGLEALLRWQSPERGLVMPGTIVPLLEETGLIVPVGGWVLRQAARDRRRWVELGLAPPPVAVNVSTAQLRRPDFVQSVADVLDLGIGDAAIDIEVTESLLVEDVEGNIRKLAKIRAMGVRIALDDFGTGYSSLGYLARLPVEMLKIDRSFIAQMLEAPGAMTLVSTMISLARSLKLRVLAEGVETEEQAKFLRLLRCDEIQGFLIARPMPFEEVITFLRG